METPDLGGEPRARADGRRRWLLRLGLRVFALLAHVWGVVLPAVSPVYPAFHRDFFAIARWLRQADPDPTRGRICARFYAAIGV